MQTAHRIQRLILNAHTNEESCFTVRSELTAAWESLLPSLSNAFDELAGPDELIRIPRLELTIKVTDVDNIYQQLSTALANALESQREAFSQAHHEESSLPFTIPSKQERDNSTDYTSAQPTTSSTTTSLHNVDVQTLFDYLHTGSIAWYLRDVPDVGIKLRQLAEQNRNTTLSYLTDCLMKGSGHHSIVLRWLNIWPSAEQLDNITTLVEHNELTSAAIIFIEQLLNNHLVTTGKQQQLMIIAEYLKNAISQKQSDNNPPTLSSSVSLNPSQWLQWESTLKRLISFTTNDIDIVRTLFQPSDLIQLNDQDVHSASENITRVKAASANTNHHQDQTSSLPAYSVNFAGAILLHPYLPRLFKACGIQYDHEGIAPAHLNRAAALIVYAASGQESTLEFELDFIATLLGLENSCSSSSDDIPSLFISNGMLNVDDKAEIDNLLTSFISHWQKLKNTSVAGLQQTFLQRQGWLRNDVHEYQLHIERIGPDVLIDFLPFSISMVKLPWMQKPLQVSW